MQLVAIRNFVVGRKTYVIGQNVDDIEEKRLARLIEDGFVMAAQPKEEFLAAFDEEVEALDPEKPQKKVRK